MKTPVPRSPVLPVLTFGAGWVLAGLALFTAVGRADVGLPESAPAAVGLSAVRLERVPAMLRREIDAHRYAGAVWLVARDGAAVSHGAIGWSDVATRTPMTEDTIFRVFSMTKIVTTATVLSLVEAGRLNLDDPVERTLPRLARRQVFAGGTAEAPRLEAAARPITIRDLLTHTSGLTYDFFETGALRTIWTRADLWRSPSLGDFVGRVSALPLAHQPGASWTYGVNMDILGAVIEAVTHEDLETAMRERVFVPLGMRDTTFRPDRAMAPRIATILHRTAEGGFGRDEPMTALGSLAFASGGGGLFSTLHDYGRFAQMLVNGGDLDGVRVLGRLTVEMMRTNQIADVPGGGSWRPDAFGFGVRIRPPAGRLVGAIGSPGEFGWDGLATTYVSMNPREHMVILLLMQHTPWNEGGIFERFEDTVYQAVER